MKYQQYIQKLEDILTNKYCIGIFMIIITIGSRFIVEELTPKQKQYIKNKWVRRLFIFCVVFMATKDLCVTVAITGVFIILISGYLTNEKKDIDIKDDQKQKIMNDIESSLKKNLG